MIRHDQGFTLTELLVVLLLLTPLWAAAAGLAATTSRAAARSASLAAAESAAADAAAILSAELGEARPGADLLLLAPDRLRLHARRGTGLICRADSAGVVVNMSTWAATRLPVPGRDSLVLQRVAVDSSGVRETLRAALTAAPFDEPCSPTMPGLRLPASLESLTLPGFTWAPLVMTSEVIDLAAYTSGGLTWVGIRHIGLGSPIEPVAGPFAAGGVRLLGLDGAGVPVADPAAVRAVRIRLETAEPSRVVREVVAGLEG